MRRGVDREITRTEIVRSLSGLVSLFQFSDYGHDGHHELIQSRNERTIGETRWTSNVQSYASGELVVHFHAALSGPSPDDPPSGYFCASFERPWIGVFNRDGFNASEITDGNVGASEYFEQRQPLMFFGIRKFVECPKGGIVRLICPKRLTLFDESLKVRPESPYFPDSVSSELLLFDENGELRSRNWTSSVFNRQMVDGVVEPGPQMMGQFARNDRPFRGNRFNFSDLAALFSDINIVFDGNRIGFTFKPGIDLVLKHAELLMSPVEPDVRIGEWGCCHERTNAEPKSSLLVKQVWPNQTRDDES